MTKVQITFTDTSEGLVDVEAEITDFNDASNAQALALRAMDHINEIAAQQPETALPDVSAVIAPRADKPLRLITP